MDTQALIAAARNWLRTDPDPDTAAELSALIDAENIQELRSRFDERLEFGTAGIRGAMGAGPARMNRVVVRRVTAGLAARLLQDGQPGGRIVVVGRDARHKSDVFAADVAAVLSLAGFDVRVFSEPVPTPLVAFATRELGAAAGVQITASHNPPADNGYKVYWQGGAQIVAPLDKEISAEIDVAEAPDDDAVRAAPSATPIDNQLIAAYRQRALSLLHGGGRRDLRIVYTPLHGVAGATVMSLLADAGFEHVHPVSEQFTPDGDFPTVDFPNPEVPGALDLAEMLAQKVDADLVLANDPDGDRIAVAVPGTGGIHILTGDEVGCLLADQLLEHGLGSGGQSPDGQPQGPRLVATTVVSSQLLPRIAVHHGVEFAETLTGFKWLARAVEDAAARGVAPVLAYEQALGVMLGDVVRDKDGMSAAVVVADLAARLADQGRTLADVLDDLARRHGLHATTGRNKRLDDAEEGTAQAIVEKLRTAPPEQVQGVPVIRVDDFVESRRRYSDGTTETIDIPTHPLVSLVLADGSRLQVRPSGTEPLLKFYIEVVEQVADGDVAAARQAAEQRLEALADAFVALA